MMLSRNRSGEQSVNAAPPSPTRIQDPFPILVGEDIATSEATRISAQRSVETGGSFLTRARGRLGVSTIIAANVRVIETQSSHSSVQRLTAADNASAASSEHCFFVDGKWECVGDRCRIQKHRVD